MPELHVVVDCVFFSLLCLRSIFSLSVNLISDRRFSIKVFYQISRVICKPVSALSNHITFEGRALIKRICEPCFVDYQSTAIGILRNKRSGEDSFRGRE